MSQIKYKPKSGLSKNHVFNAVISSEQVRKLNLYFPAHHLEPDLIQSEPDGTSEIEYVRPRAACSAPLYFLRL